MSLPSSSAAEAQPNVQGPPVESINLTGGIEIECILLTDSRVPHATEPLSDAGVIYAAFSAPLRVVCVECNARHDYKLPLADPDQVLSEGDFTMPEDDYSKWNIAHDGTVSLYPEQDLFRDVLEEDTAVSDIELKSRVLNLTGKFGSTPSRSHPGHVHKITYREEVEAVYERLNKSFNVPGSDLAQKHRLVVNSTCSTHVHVGDGSRGFSPETVKKVLSIIVTHEKQFDSIHSVDRITGTDRLAHDDGHDDLYKSLARYNGPWSKVLIASAFEHDRGESREQELCRLYPDTYDQSQVVYPASRFASIPGLQLASQHAHANSWLDVIDGAESVDDLRKLQLHHHGRNATVNLFNLKEGDPMAKMTIEFRQHKGTLQPDEILNWVGTLVSLFQYASATDTAEVRRMCLDTLSNPNFSMLDLLKKFGLRAEDDIMRHYSKVLSRVDGLASYAETKELQELDAVSRFGSEDFWVPLMAHLVRRMRQSSHPDRVHDFIDNKFSLGGYGQFSESYLRRYNGKELTAAQIKYLTLGYCPLWSTWDRGASVPPNDDDSDHAASGDDFEVVERTPAEDDYEIIERAPADW